MKCSIAVIVKTKKFRDQFAKEEDFVEFRERMQKDLQRYMHQCHFGDTVYASNWVEETTETAKEHNCPIGKLRGWDATMTGPVFYIEGQDDYFWTVLPIKG